MRPSSLLKPRPSTLHGWGCPPPSQLLIRLQSLRSGQSPPEGRHGSGSTACSTAPPAQQLSGLQAPGPSSRSHGKLETQLPAGAPFYPPSARSGRRGEGHPVRVTLPGAGAVSWPEHAHSPGPPCSSGVLAPLGRGVGPEASGGHEGPQTKPAVFNGALPSDSKEAQGPPSLSLRETPGKGGGEKGGAQGRPPPQRPVTYWAPSSSAEEAGEVSRYPFT